VRQLGFTAGERRVREMLAPGRRLSVPPFQRAYAWGEPQAEALLADLIEAREAGRPHFLGTVVLARPRVEHGEQVHDVIDGQQRLTTLTLLLAVLRDLEPEADLARSLQELIADPARPFFGEAGGVRLIPQPVDAPYFAALAQAPGGTGPDGPLPGVGPSQQRLYANVVLFREQLATRPPEDRRTLCSHIIQRCGVVEVETPDVDGGFHVFRVLNARGLPLDAHELLKSALLDAAALPAEDARRVARDWAQAEAEIGTKGVHEALQAIRLAHDRSGNSALTHGFLKAVLAEVPARVVLEDLFPRHVAAVKAIDACQVAAGHQSQAVNGCLAFLSELESSSWRPPAVHFLVHRGNDPDTVRDFFEDLERLAFALSLVGYDRTVKARRLKRVMDVCDDDRALFGNASPFRLSQNERDQMRRKLRKSVTNYGFRRALTLRLNAALVGGEVIVPNSDVTVEHVLPRTPDPGSGWSETWPDVGEQRELSETLGNFVLLSQSDNQRADRAGWEVKRAVFFPDGRPARYALTRDVADVASWTPDVVRARTERLASVLEQVWHLDRA